MMKISFEFDEVTKEISNFVVIKTRDMSSKTSINNLDSLPDTPCVELTDKALQLNSEAMKVLNLKAGDRILINYHQVDNQTTFPVIGKSGSFGTELEGNVVTKIGKIRYSGSQNKVLSLYGSVFSLEPYENIEGVFIMNPVTDKSDEDLELDDISDNPDRLIIDKEFTENK